MMNDMPELILHTEWIQRAGRRSSGNLMGKGIDRKTAINAWEEEAALNMPDEKEILYRTIEKKYPPDTELDEKKMRRLYGYLVRRGFGYSDIADTLGEYEYQDLYIHIRMNHSILHCMYIAKYITENRTNSN